MTLDVSGYGRWTVTELGRQVLKSAATVQLRRESLQPPLAKARHKRSLVLIGRLNGADRILFDALKAARQELAKAHVPGCRCLGPQPARHGASEARHAGADGDGPCVGIRKLRNMVTFFLPSSAGKWRRMHPRPSLPGGWLTG